MKSNLKLQEWLIRAVIVMICLVGGAGLASAAVGTTDSPLFNINTLWATGVEDQANLPRVDRLGGCYPNPFNPQTTINYELARRTVVDLRIYDLQGRLVRVLAANELLDPGVHQADWDGRDGRGSNVAAGIYLYRLVTESFTGSQRMTLLK